MKANLKDLKRGSGEKGREKISHDPVKFCTNVLGFQLAHVTWREALKPNGPLLRQILEEIRK